MIFKYGKRFLKDLAALPQYDKLDDDTFPGRIPVCKGVISFDTILAGCETELRSVLEDWILVGLKMGHRLPVTSDIDLNA